MEQRSMCSTENELSKEREMHEIRWRRVMKGNERQAEREEGSKRGRDEWRATGVVAGQASCQGAPLTPCTERRRDTKQREGSEEKERKRAGREGSKMMREKRK